MRIDCVISHDGKNWRLSSEALSLAAPSLPQLDAQVRTALIRDGIVGKGEQAEVFMAFDNSTIPGWIRPFAGHYFNRIIEIKGDQ